MKITNFGIAYAARLTGILIGLIPILGIVVWEPAIHDGARTETVSMLRNCSVQVIIAGSSAHQRALLFRVFTHNLQN